MSISAMTKALEALESIKVTVSTATEANVIDGIDLFPRQIAELRIGIAEAEKQERPVNPLTWKFESLGHAMLVEGKPFYRSGKKISLSAMRPGEKFILVRTGQIYSIKDSGSVWNETENRPSRLHKNCQVEPLYTVPVHAIDMSQECVDETAKYRHEWVEQPDLARVGEVGVWGDKREWVEITKGECDELFRASSDHVEYAWAIEAKLKEKNNG